MKQINKKYQSVPASQAAADIDAPVNQRLQGAVAYQKPKLTCYGDVRDITLGPTPGLGESGMSLNHKS